MSSKSVQQGTVRPPMQAGSQASTAAEVLLTLADGRAKAESLSSSDAERVLQPFCRQQVQREALQMGAWMLLRRHASCTVRCVCCPSGGCGGRVAVDEVRALCPLGFR